MSGTEPSMAPGLGFHCDVAIDDTDTGRRVGGTARQAKKNVSPDLAQNWLKPAHCWLLCPTAHLLGTQDAGHGLLHQLHAHQSTVPNGRDLPFPFFKGMGSSHTADVYRSPSPPKCESVLGENME